MANAQKALFGIFIQHFNLLHLNHYICLIVLSGQTTGYPFIYAFICCKFTIFISHDQLPSGDLFRRSWVRIRPGSGIFALSPCGPTSLLGFSLRRYYLGYLLEHFSLPNLNQYIVFLCFKLSKDIFLLLLQLHTAVLI